MHSDIKQKQKRLNKGGRKGNGKKERNKSVFLKDVRPKIGRDREEGWSLMRTVFLRGLRRIVFWDVCPTLTVLRFQQTKEIRPSYVIIRSHVGSIFIHFLDSTQIINEYYMKQ